MKIWLWAKLLRIQEVHFAIFSGIMLSLGANYLSADENTLWILLKSIGWLMAGSGMIWLGDMIRESKETDLRVQRADLLDNTAPGDFNELALRQIAVLEPRQEMMLNRIKTLESSHPNYEKQMRLVICAALVLPSVLGTALIFEKLLPDMVKVYELIIDRTTEGSPSIELPLTPVPLREIQSPSKSQK